MTATAIIREALSEGVKLTLSTAGTIKATGDDVAVGRWVAVIREHKAEIVDALKVCAGDTAPPSRWWLIHYPGRDPVQVSCTPPATRAEILEGYPDAIAAEPFTPTIRQPSAPLPVKEETAIRAWLAHIEESDPVTIAEMLAQCSADPEALAYCLKQASQIPLAPCADEGVPNGTAMEWITGDPEIADQYARAREPDYRATCGACKNFQRINHPNLGHCAKGEPEAPAGLWATDRRWCTLFSPDKQENFRP